LSPQRNSVVTSKRSFDVIATRDATFLYKQNGWGSAGQSSSFLRERMIGFEMGRKPRFPIHVGVKLTLLAYGVEVLQRVRVAFLLTVQGFFSLTRRRIPASDSRRLLLFSRKVVWRVRLWIFGSFGSWISPWRISFRKTQAKPLRICALFLRSERTIGNHQNGLESPDGSEFVMIEIVRSL